MKTLLFVLGLLLCFVGYSQNETILVSKDSTTHLYLENKKSHKQVEIIVGDMLSYKKVGSYDHVKSKVIGFTSTGVSFENKKKESVSILYKDIESIVISRRTGRLVGGVALIVAGAASVIWGISVTGQNNNGIGGSTLNSSGHGLAIGGVAAVVGGIILVQPKRIDLQKSWEIKTSTTQQ